MGAANRGVHRIPGTLPGGDRTSSRAFSDLKGILRSLEVGMYEVIIQLEYYWLCIGVCSPPVWKPQRLWAWRRSNVLRWVQGSSIIYLTTHLNTLLKSPHQFKCIPYVEYVLCFTVRYPGNVSVHALVKATRLHWENEWRPCRTHKLLVSQLPWSIDLWFCIMLLPFNGQFDFTKGTQ